MEVARKIAEILNNCKNFEPGYSGITLQRGMFYVRYRGKPYAVKITEMDDATVTDADKRLSPTSSEETVKDFKNIEFIEDNY